MAWGFPSREGIKGCVMVTVAAWAEGLRDTVSRGLVLRGVIRQASGDHFDFQVAVRGRYTPPAPLERGDLGCLFLVGNEMFEWGCFPSREGRLEAAFFLVMRDLSGDISPLERGFKGCVMVRGAVWAEELRDTVSRGLVLRGAIRQASGDCFWSRRSCLGVTHPSPSLGRGDLRCSFLFGNERFMACGFSFGGGRCKLK